MKAKLIGLVVGLLSAATVGVVQLQAEAAGHPSGQVGSAPICEAKAEGLRGNVNVDLTTTNASNLAYDVENGVAKVKFKVTGPNNCKVRLSNNSFWAQNQNGKPFDKQVLFQRETKVFTPGRHTMSVRVPTQPKRDMCFYQVDLTYGTHNVTPVLAFGHGKILGCLPKPSAECKSLSVQKLSDTRFRFNASASVKNGAKVKGYTFIVKRGNQVVKTQPIATPKLSTSFTYTAPSDGNYTVQVKVRTSVGEKSGSNCIKSFKVDREQPTPGIEVNKLVEGVDYLKTETNVEFEYQITVSNTGETDLTNVAVTDTPENGVTLLSASAGTITDNVWTHTIASLPAGETMDFTIQAKVPEFLAGRIKNTVCVDAPQVPGTPPCDDADVEVEEPGKVRVCDPETGEIIFVDEEDADNYPLPDSDECGQEVVCDPETGELIEVPVGEQGNYEPSDSDACGGSELEEIVEELPETGPAEALLQLVGVGSLTGSSAYYLASRRKLQ